MDVFSVTPPDIVQLTGASSSSLTALTCVMSIALGKSHRIPRHDNDRSRIPLVFNDVLLKLVFGEVCSES